LSDKFNPEAPMERMKWIMEYNVLDDLKVKGADYMDFRGSVISQNLTIGGADIPHICLA
jgi:salicylate hydroxylase